MLSWDGYCAAIGANAAHCSVFGFIDGTVRKICESSFGQRSMYNGHKCFHALKYQAVVAPDGIIIHISNSSRGNVHDLTIFDRLQLPVILREHAWSQNGRRRLAIYGDPAYRLRAHILWPMSSLE